MTLLALALAPAQAQERNIPDDLPNPITLTITGAETGDRGCYLWGTQTTEKGPVEWEMMGEFGCEYSLLPGHTYAIDWREQNVLAAVCEGNVDCGLSDVEAVASNWTLVSKAKVAACQEPATPADRVACAEGKAEQAETELASLYMSTRMDFFDDEEFVEALERSQSTWAEYLEAQVTVRSRRLDGPCDGLRAVCIAAYTEELTRRQIAEVEALVDGSLTCDGCAGSVNPSR
jgi:uncharacterized protein YecT (DUF1311 family)